MKKQNILWKKRIAFLLSTALIFGEIGSNAATIRAAEVPKNTSTTETEKNVEKTLPVPDEYISLNETEETAEVKEATVNAGSQKGSGEEIIPIIGKDDWKAKKQESEVAEETVNSADTEEQQAMPSAIPVIAEQEAEVNVPEINASDVTTPAAITVDDVISRSGYENTYGEYVTEQFSFVPEEDGYYSMELTQKSNSDVSVYLYKGEECYSSQSLYTSSDYTDFMTYPLEKGENYTWIVEYDLYEEDSNFKLLFEKNSELQVSDNQATGTAGKKTSFAYQLKQPGLLQIFIESEKGYSYYLSSNAGNKYKISQDAPLKVFYQDIMYSNIRFDLWKNSEEEDKVTVKFEVVPASSIEQTGVLQTVQASKKQSPGGYSEKEILVAFTPQESGCYAFETGMETSWYSRRAGLYRYEETTDGQGWYNWTTYYGNSTNSIVADLEAGKQYYYYAEEGYDIEEFATEIPIMVTKLDSQKVELGSKVSLSKAAKLTFDVEAEKFYQVILRSNDEKIYGMMCMNLQKIGYGEYDTNKFLNKKLFANESGEANLMFTRTQDLDRDGSYTVEIREYDVPELQENVVLENEDSLSAYDYMLCKFTPSEDGIYNFWGISYTNVWQNFYISYKQDGYFNQISWLDYTDEFDTSVELAKDVTYYLTTGGQSAAEPGDYLVCQGKAETASIDLTNSTEASAEIDMYKSAKVQITIPEKGFYQLTATGSANSYHINYEDATTLYKGISKTVYFNEAGAFTINLSREFPKGSGKDKVTFAIKKNDSIDSLQTYTMENPSKQEVVLGDSNDVCWYQFTPEETGSYLFNINSKDDEDLNVYLQIYTEDTQENCLRSMDCSTYGTWNNRNYYLNSSLQQKNVYYVKATTYAEGARVDLCVLKCAEGNVEKLDETVSLNTSYAANYKCNIPEDGIYEIKLQAQKDQTDYIVWRALGDSDTWWNSSNSIHKEYAYLTKGIRSILVSPYNGNTGEDTISITLSKVETKTDLKNVTLEKEQTWVKYTPEESGYYMLGSVLEQQDDGYYTWADLYQKTADNCLSYCDDGYEQNGEIRISYYLEKGYEYYIRIRGYKAPRNATVYAQKNESVEGTLDQEIELTFAKACDITIPDLTVGFYEISLEGDTEKYSVGLARGNYYSQYPRNFGNKNTKVVFLRAGDLEYNDGRLCFEIVAKGIPADNSCKIKIRKIEVSPQDIELGNTITKTAESDVEAYSFTPDKTGYYSIACNGLSDGIYMYNEDDDYLDSWWDQRLYAGITYKFFILNEKGNNYSFTLSKKNRMYVYDYNTYNAFIASGGSISIQKSEDITEDMWEDELYSMNNMWDGNYLVCSAKNFKNKNDIWFLGYSQYMELDSSATTYQPIEAYLQEYGYSYDTNTYEYKYQYLCDNQGNKLNGNSPLTEPYIAYAVFAPEYVPVEKITIQGTSALELGATAKLTAKLETGLIFEPTNKNVTWSSSDSSIVSVDAQGNIKANKVGKAVITCKSQDKAGNSGSITIVVAQNVVYASKVVITGSTKVNVGESITLKASIDTAGKGKPTKDGVTWTSSDKTVAKVDAKGKVTGVRAGKVTITAVSNDGKAKADYTITVKNINAKKISLNESKITMKKGTTYQWLEVSFSPKNTTDKKIKWTTSNKKVATVDKKGNIKAVGIGKAEITATSSNGKKDTVKVTVTKDSLKAKKISLPSKKTMKVGEKLTLSAEFTPVNTTNKKVKWESSNTKVATVSSKGVVKAKKTGTVIIKVTTQDGTKKTAKCKITVKKAK